VIDLVAHPDLTEVFTVGDEFQSIYGFRHADLEVFRERRAEAPSLLAMTQNYRSRPQVLDAVNHLFADAFGDDFQPLSSSPSSPIRCSAIRSSCSSPTRRASPDR
jgi:ATP-dependent exoDNAse (exonuclease V) beta subunit